MKFSRTIFLIAGVYGLIVLLPQYLLEAKTGRDFPPPITHPEFYYGFLGVTVAWQILFLFLATNPERYRPLMIPAVLEKIAFIVPVAGLFLNHRVSSLMLVPAALDLILAALFVVAYAKTNPSESQLFEGL